MVKEEKAKKDKLAWEVTQEGILAKSFIDLGRRRKRAKAAYISMRETLLRLDEEEATLARLKDAFLGSGLIDEVLLVEYIQRFKEKETASAPD